MQLNVKFIHEKNFDFSKFWFGGLAVNDLYIIEQYDGTYWIPEQINKPRTGTDKYSKEDLEGILFIEAL